MSTDPIDTLSLEPLDDTDAHVLAALRDLHDRIDPVPEGLAERMKFGITLAALHAEIAELQDLSLAGARDDTAQYAATESVTFAARELSLMVSIGPAGEDGVPGTVRIDGWVSGPAARVELRIGTQSRSAELTDGRFAFEDVPHGAARFVLWPTNPEGRPVLTPSIEV